MGVKTTKFLGKFGEIVFILRNAFIYRGLRKFLGDCYTLSPIIYKHLLSPIIFLIVSSLFAHYSLFLHIFAVKLLTFYLFLYHNEKKHIRTKV